jgi:hypothetical protein
MGPRIFEKTKISCSGSGNIKKKNNLEELGADEKISRYIGSRD